MHANESNDSQPADAAGVRATAIDVHNHAMPLPLLEWLEGAGLSDLSRIGDGVVMLDPAVSGVGKNAPLPLARSQYDPRARLAEMDDVGVWAHAVSMPPFLYPPTPKTRARHHNDRAWQRRTRHLCRRGLRPIVRSRVYSARIPRRRERGSTLP